MGDNVVVAEVRERPILFSGPMVQAILDGRKTQTRRVVKWKPREPGLNVRFSGLELGHYHTAAGDRCGWVLRSRGAGGCWGDRTHPALSPFGLAGHRLWVRETWAPARFSENAEYGDVCYFEWDADLLGPPSLQQPMMSLHYRADGEDGNPAEFSMSTGSEIRWRPSIHMPRWASRLALEVTGVRIERLQSITEDDARAEGVVPHLVDPDGPAWEDGTHRGAFQYLWDELNAERGFGWESNPWVWVIGFRRLDG